MSGLFIKEIVERIKKLDHLSKDNETAKALGMEPGALSQAITRGSIPYEKLFMYAQEKSLSLDWLLTGKGSMERSAGDQAEPPADRAVCVNEINAMLDAVRSARPLAVPPHVALALLQSAVTDHLIPSAAARICLAVFQDELVRWRREHPELDTEPEIPDLSKWLDTGD